VAATLAYGEGLQAHARSAEFRLKPNKWVNFGAMWCIS
jgi:hypothetical protein